MFFRLKGTINYIIDLLDDKKTGLKKFISLKRLFYSFIGLLVNITRITIDNKDFTSLNKILSVLQEFYLTPKTGIYDKKFELEARLKTLKTDSEDYNNIKDQISVINERIKVEPEYEEHLLKLRFEIGSYLLCRIKENRIEKSQFNYIIGILDDFKSYENLLKTFEEIIKNPNEVYGNITITISGNNIDMEQCRTFFFCIKGIQLVDTINASIDSDVIKYKLSTIKSIGNELKGCIEEWDWLIGKDTDQIEKFVKICQNS